MTDTKRVQVVEAVHKLLVKERRFIGTQCSLGVDIVEQFSLGDVFKSNVTAIAQV